jgi:hypothetical protein
VTPRPRRPRRPPRPREPLLLRQWRRLPRRRRRRRRRRQRLDVQQQRLLPSRCQTPQQPSPGGQPLEGLGCQIHPTPSARNSNNNSRCHQPTSHPPVNAGSWPGRFTTNGTKTRRRARCICRPAPPSLNTPAPAELSPPGRVFACLFEPCLCVLIPTLFEPLMTPEPPPAVQHGAPSESNS